MASKNLIFVLNLHCPYIKVTQNDFSAYEAESSFVFLQMSNLFLPTLDLLSLLKEKKLEAKIGLVFSASVCEILTDPELKKRYNKWLDNLIELGKKEVARAKKNSAVLKIALANLERAKEDKRKFNEVWDGELLQAFASFANQGYAEILATCGTYLFMPHFADMTEILNAQVESGLVAVKRHFGQASDGFFLPEMGYAPGIESVIKSYGFAYTLLPSQSFLFAELSPLKGIFMPARTQNGLSILAANEIPQDYYNLGLYRDASKDLAWELSGKELSPFIKEGRARSRTFWSYVNRDDEPYDFLAAASKARSDADAFVQGKAELLKKAQVVLGDDADVFECFVFNAIDICFAWPEFFEWFSQALLSCSDHGLKISSPYSQVRGQFGAQKISPYPAAFMDFSYGEALISNKNSWMICYLRKACERIVDLVTRFSGDSGLKNRLLNLGAKELLLVQDCSLAKMLERGESPEYVSEFFKRGIVSFSNIFDALGSNSVSTEWFCAMEKLHPVMPWLNYRIFSKKR